MMNVQENLLATFKEELGEVLQAAGKCSRFGLTEKWVSKRMLNVQALNVEFLDVIVLWEMLIESGANLLTLQQMNSDPVIQRNKEVKRKRVLDNMERSRRLGTLEPIKKQTGLFEEETLP